MNAITLPVRKKTSGRTKVHLIPSNRSEEGTFGLVDGLILGFFLMVVAGLASLLFLR